jgi:hypothetical protein
MTGKKESGGRLLMFISQKNELRVIYSESRKGDLSKLPYTKRRARKSVKLRVS